RPLVMRAVPTPVAVLTARQVTAEAATQEGVAWVMRKPFDLEDLLLAIKRQIHPRQSRALQTFIIKQFFAALNSRDWKRVARLCIPEVEVRSLLAPAVALAGLPSGLLTYRALMEQRFSALPGYYIFEEVQVFARPIGVAARYMVCWEDRSEVVHRVAGS